MDKLLIRKDVYEELLEKGFGKKDYSKLTKKKIILMKKEQSMKKCLKR